MQLGKGANTPFPAPHQALEQPNGLLAFGGDLTPERLLNAYSQGIFPWYSDGEPILWWSPDPRAVLITEELRLPRSLKKRLRQRPFRVTLNHAFDRVIAACAAPRTTASPGTEGTWITAEMSAAYHQLHHLGHAHSVECWQEDRLVGGLYGVQIGRLFCGESMFTRVSDASKIALVTLLTEAPTGPIELLDIQMMSDHLRRLGAREIPRIDYLRRLPRLLVPSPHQ